MLIVHWRSVSKSTQSVSEVNTRLPLTDLATRSVSPCLPQGQPAPIDARQEHRDDVVADLAVNVHFAAISTASVASKCQGRCRNTEMRCRLSRFKSSVLGNHNRFLSGSLAHETHLQTITEMACLSLTVEGINETVRLH